MRAVEQAHLLEQLQGVPAQPWLWLSPCASWIPEPVPAGRGMRLSRATDGRGWQGDVRCGLPLPLPAEAVNAIVLQHAALPDLDMLFSECERVLMPGGRLWLTLLNRCSPYRAHWQWRGARPPSATWCRMLLQREGLQCRAVRRLGPLWRTAAGVGAVPLLRAVCVLEFEKRTLAGLGPEVARPLGWRKPVAT